jgi:SAM-dependent methyltransferase
MAMTGMRPGAPDSETALGRQMPQGTEGSPVSDAQDSVSEMRTRLRKYWDADAPTYDRSSKHVPHTAAERAAWTEALLRHMPPAPARVLEVGAGTGFLSVILAECGYQVTAVDFAPSMLDILNAKAARAGVEIEVVESAAETPPPGPFDVVVERMLLWTLPDPAEALEVWRGVAPRGRLLSFGRLWDGDRLEAARARSRHIVGRFRHEPPEHHAPYPAWFSGSNGTPRPHPEYVVNTIESAGWHGVRLERLRDVEWAHALSAPIPLRLLGMPPEFAVIADAIAGAPR